MAIFFPDLSHYDLDRGVRLEPGTVAVIVKGTHGQLFVDSAYQQLRAQAFQVGAYTTAYHWLNHGNADKQALFCWQQLGRIPVMIDAEDQPGNSGYTGPLTVGDIATFAQTLRELGGTCNLVYLPRWYWQGQMGSPDLRPLGAIGLGLVSSNYTTYSDSGPGWNSYGGMAPVQWQYTDALPYGGTACDFNAFKGSLDDYKTLTQGGTDMSGLDDFPPGVPQMVADLWRYFHEGKGAFGGTELAGWTLPKLWAQTAADAHDALTAATKASVAAQLAANAAQNAAAAIGNPQLTFTDDQIAGLVAALAPKVADELAKRLGNG